MVTIHRASESNLDIVESALPLRITYANMAPDPFLTLSGDGWGSNYTCPWVLRGPGILIDPEARDELTDENQITNDDIAFLIGREIIGITSGPDMIDPILHITGGISLEVTADTFVDPWMIRLPDIVIVGTMAPPE
ncbi:hypothetical protein [Mycetocola sp. JXN-3]|uniref:hypothetical protein n=1 Tax=Mycetocola sp. JXN-3 TaxID=2116510 RepID=UPI00165D0F4B|nr:hypothetical protein [Mycetocola sp. JXN-3]